MSQASLSKGRWMRALMALALLAWMLPGCTVELAKRMVAPPNGLNAATVLKPPSDPTEHHVVVGPPHAVLVVRVLEPEQGPEKTPAKGTILALHGFINDHTQQQGAAKNLQKAGYRVVLVDLRGHGDSPSDYITFGAQDAKDLVQLTNYLQEKKLCGPTVGVFGCSYGGATAILFAAQDTRVVSVVAVAPFASLRQEAPHFGKNLFPIPGRFFSDENYTNIVNRMGRIAGFNPDDCDVVAKIPQAQAKIRLFHGSFDAIVPVRCSKQLAAAAPDKTELTVLVAKGHLDMCFDLFGTLYEPTREWFDQTLPGTTPAETLVRSSQPPNSNH